MSNIKGLPWLPVRALGGLQKTDWLQFQPVKVKKCIFRGLSSTGQFPGQRVAYACRRRLKLERR